MTVETTTVQIVEESTTVQVTEVDETVVGSSDEATLIIATAEIGPRGPQGELGPTGLSAYEVALLEGFIGTEEQWLESLVGPQGLSGGSYTHNQLATSDTWVVVHNLGYHPNVSTFDSGDTQVVGDVTHDSVNQLTVSFSSAFSGTAYLS